VSADTWLTVRRQESRSVFFRKAVWQHGLPDKATIDKSGANATAIDALQEEAGHDIEISQIKYLNNLVEQDHFMLSGYRDEAAATAFFKQAITMPMGCLKKC
jgi:transposase-like protein